MTMLSSIIGGGSSSSGGGWRVKYFTSFVPGGDGRYYDGSIG